MKIQRVAPLLLTALAASMVGGQEPIKPIRLDGQSKFATKVNEGVDRYLHGDLKGALKVWDDASLLDFSSPIPWMNGAIANLDLGRLARAARANQQVGLMGDRSIRRITLASEIDTARGQLGNAWQQILAGEFQHPDDPYVHVARAKYADADGQVRMAERSRWQAYRLGETPLVDSKLFSNSGLGLDGGLPTALDLFARTRQVGQSAALVGSIDLGTEDIGGPAHALQRVLSADFSSATSLGMIMGSFHHLLGDRPGELDYSTLFSSTPGARLRYDYETAGWQKTWGEWTMNANYREAKADLRATDTAPYVRNTFQTQWMAEGRYDSGPWTAGASTSDVFRDSVANPAIEPLEEVFGQGHTRLSDLYLVRRTDLARSIRLITGGALTTVEGTSHGLFTAEVAVKLFGDQYLRIGAKPTMNRVGTNLFPEDLRARLQTRSVGSQNTPLFNPNGKQLDLYAEVPAFDSRSAHLQIRGFQTQFTDALFASGDPQQVASMNETPLRRGTITGATASATLTSGTSFKTTAAATLQSSRGEYLFLQESAQVPNVPNFAASFTFDANVSDWSFALATNYLGPRIQSSTGLNTAGTTGTQTRQVQGAWNIEAHLSRPFGQGSLMLSGFNLSRSAIYPGFGVSSAIRLSYLQRF
ncbi:MAG: hypothetical protein ACHQ50_07465 [Fimbriimonadales bacterium]